MGTTSRQFGEDGRIVNSACAKCEARGVDHYGHITPRGDPSCRAHGRTSGKPCRNIPLVGTSVCYRHGGHTPGAKYGAQKRLTLAKIRSELDALGGQLNVEPTEAMLVMVKEAAFNVAFLRSLVEQLRQGWESDAGAGDGIVGRVDPEKWTAKEHVLVAMYDRERDRLVRYAKMCRDAGVEERRVQIAEEQGRWLTRTLDLVFERLGLTTEQHNALPDIMRQVVKELEVVDAESWEEGVDGEASFPAPEPPGDTLA